MEEEESQEVLHERFLERIKTAKCLKEKLDQPEYARLGGSARMKKLITSEEKFLEKISLGKTPLLKKYIDTSNLIHYESIVQGIDKYKGVTGILQTFAISDSEAGELLKHTVDLVAKNGRQWVKIISRSAKGLCMDWVAGDGRNIFEQAETYLEMAELFQNDYTSPEICFEFVSAIADVMARKLRSMGITVIGDTVPIDTLTKLPSDFLEALEKEEIEAQQNRRESKSGSLPPINLDVSAVFVLISNLTHPGGTKHRFSSKLLQMQAVMEEKLPAKAQLLEQIEGREWIMCRTAYDSLQNIVSTVAGDEERKRSEEILKKIKIVDDYVTDRAAALNYSDRINNRNLTVFGSGDYYRAVTATANKHFVASAYHQGVRFDVIVHESRALSEQNQIPDVEAD